MSRTDTLPSPIAADLRALAADSRSSIPGIESALTPYRDNSEGNRAAQREELEQRRLELALMPMRLERVFVHRVSRIAAGAVALCVTAGVVGLLNPIALRIAMAFGLPLSPALIATAGAVAVLLAYVAAGWVAERYFEDRIRVATDSAGDVETALAGPLDRALGLLRRVDAWAVGAPLVATVVAVPLALFLYLVFARRPMLSHQLSDLWLSAVFDWTISFALAAVLAVACGCALIARAVHLSHSRARPPLLLRLAEHSAVWPLMFLMFFAYYMVATDVMLAYAAARALPPEWVRFALALGGTLVVALPAIRCTLWWRRREESRISAAVRELGR